MRVMYLLHCFLEIEKFYFPFLLFNVKDSISFNLIIFVRFDYIVMYYEYEYILLFYRCCYS